MKRLIAVFIILSACGTNKIETRPESLSTQTGKSLYDFTLNGITGEPIELSQYRGKKLLIVNTASKCGYTPQYEGLQELHDKYGDKVIILAFPSNDFASQEPGTNAEIASFCKENYGVTFQIFEKISVKGKEQHPLYGWLSTKKMNGWNEQTPKWNFCKYLINENGDLTKYYGSAIEPMSNEILMEIL